MTVPTVGLLTPFSFGRGYPQIERPAQPAAGAPAVLQVPGTENWRIVLARATLTTSATVASRVVHLDFLDPDGNLICDFWSAATQAASLTGSVVFAAGIPEYAPATGGPAVVPIPDIILPVGCSVGFEVASIDAADQLKALTLFIEKFDISGAGYPTGRWSDAAGISPPIP